ncbi:hypothetical protein RJ640_002994, partial [Escallonia rubra]
MLDLSYNNLEGNLPRCWPNLTSLEYIDLSSNQFTGDIRDISSSGKSFLWLIENNTELVTLVLRNNSFTGPLQMPSNPHSKLTELDIASNNFSGNIPEDIGTSFPGLEDLTMSSNRFTGTIPSSFGDMASLVSLDLSYNFLSGNIPNSLAMGCRSLFTLRLSNNNLQGSILPAHHNLTQLAYLELDVNNFTTIPNSLSNCSKLAVLKINLNHLDGPFPTAICQLKSLDYLDISENNITGILPACFSPPRIKYVKLSKNRLLLPHAFFNCTRLRFVTKSMPLVYRGQEVFFFFAIDLSCNNLAGHIPPEIGKLFHLKSLNLSHNSLSGTIPITFANLTGTESLDLSYNKLTGGTPSLLAKLDSLEVFNEPHFQTFDCMSYVSNQLLCGKPVSRNCTDPESALVTPRNRKGTEFMDMGTFY